jgi:hypothetical protein
MASSGSDSGEEVHVHLLRIGMHSYLWFRVNSLSFGRFILREQSTTEEFLYQLHSRVSLNPCAKFLIFDYGNNHQ